jgi:hypothetical protein
MKREYVTFVRKISDLAEGKRTLFIKDLTAGPRKYDTRLVRAELARRSEEGPDDNVLWIRSETGYLHPQPWTIRILEELPPHVPGQPWQDVFASLKQLK